MQLHRTLIHKECSNGLLALDNASKEGLWAGIAAQGIFPELYYLTDRRTLGEAMHGREHAC